MDAIRALQRQLHEVQETSKINKLSERNCVELVAKLLELDKVKLIYTSNGKEYLTPEQLELEIREALISNGGRLNVVNLPNEVGVNIEHCQAKAEYLCKKDSWLTMLHGEMIAKYYLQQVAQEMDESLVELGSIGLSEVASRFSLPADFVRNSVLPLLSTNYVFKQDTIYTQAHAARLEARARGIFHGVTQPTTVTQVAQAHGLDAEIVANTLQKLLKEGSVQGKCSGSTFTPKVFDAAQSSKLEEFFSANNFVPLQMCKSQGISDVAKWFKERMKVHGVMLRTAFVSEAMLDPVLAGIKDGVDGSGFVDVTGLLPTSFAPLDAEDLLQYLGRGKVSQLQEGWLTVDHYVVGQKYLQQAASAFEKKLLQAAEQCAKSGAAAGVGAAGTKKSAAAKRNEDDDEAFSGSKAKSKGSKKTAKSKKGKAADDDDEEGGGVAGGSEDAAWLSEKELCDAMAEKCPEVPEQAWSGELGKRLRRLLAMRFAEEVEKLRSSMQSNTRKQFEEASKNVVAMYDALQSGLRALGALGLQDSALTAYLFKEYVADIMHTLLCVKWEELSGEVLEVTANTRKQILEKMEKKAKAPALEPFKKLLDITVGKKYAEVVEAVAACADEVHIFCKKQDKKREKSALVEKRAESRQALMSETPLDPLEIGRLSLTVLVAKDPGAVLLIPGEIWALKLVVEKLPNSLDEGARTTAGNLCELLERKQKAPEDAEVAVELEAAAGKLKELTLPLARG